MYESIFSKIASAPLLFEEGGEISSLIDPVGDGCSGRLLGLGQVVFREDTGLVAGEPGTCSLSCVLPVTSAQVTLGRLWLCGLEPVLVGAKETSFLQIILLRRENVDRIFLARASALRSLSNKLPGYMAGSRDLMIGARIHKDLMREGFSRRRLARVLATEFLALASCPAQDLSMVVGFACDDAINLLRADCEAWEAARMLPEQATAESFATGFPDCDQLGCSFCVDKVVCDRIRTISGGTGRR